MIVQSSPWSVSVTTGSGIAGAVLAVHRCEDVRNEFGGIGVTVRHPEFYGLEFVSADAAWSFAVSVGLVTR